MQALDALRDLHFPEAVSYWPLAPGYYLLILIFLFLAWLTFSFLKKPKTNFKRQALLILEACERSYLNQRDDQKTARELSALLKRVALLYFPRKEVASLSGEAWIDFLSSTDKKLDFKPFSQELLLLPYQKAGVEGNLQPLIDLVRLWIKKRGKPCLN